MHNGILEEEKDNSQYSNKNLEFFFKVSGATARWPFTDSAVPSSLLLRSAGLQPADLLLILLFLPHYYSYSYSYYYYYYYSSNINFQKPL